MGRVSSLFVHKVIAATAPGRAAELYASIGVDPTVVDPKHMVPDQDYYALCERAVAGDAEPDSLPLRVGASMRVDEYGAFGLAFKAAVDLRGSYLRSARYGLVLTSVSTYEVRSEGGRHFMMLHRQGTRAGLQISNEQTIAAIAAISAEVSSQPFRIEAIHFAHPARGDALAHAAHFGCPVHFGSDRTALELSEETLATPNRLGDQRIAEFLDAHLAEEVAGLQESLEATVSHEIAKSLSEGAPSVQSIAARLGMSGRTLQRRLADEGAVFQDLVDKARQDLALRLLGSTDYALAEIAFLTGFAEQSTFTRAFKRWQGKTPATYRRSRAVA